MLSDERYILEQLLREIEVFRSGGIVRLLDTPLLLKSLFSDSLLHLDYGYTPQMRPCGECQPFNFAFLSPDLEDVPCHHTLGKSRVTIEDGYPPLTFEAAVTNWLRARVAEIKNTSH